MNLILYCLGYRQTKFRRYSEKLNADLELIERIRETPPQLLDKSMGSPKKVT